MMTMRIAMLSIAFSCCGIAGAEAACAGAFLQAQAIEDCLDRPAQAATPRSVGQARAWPGRNLAVTPMDPMPDAPPTVNLWVNFAFDSADLSTDTRITLDELARALRGPRLTEKRFVVAGHTDAVGSADYNLELSERRARAVYAYLVGHGDVPPARLATEGWGFTRPLNPNDPKAAENRRVEVRVVE